MKKRNIKLFDKATHEVKKLMSEIAAERKKYMEESIEKDKARILRRRKHDREIKNEIRELKRLLGHLYKLFTDLDDAKQYCLRCRKLLKREK